MYFPDEKEAPFVIMRHSTELDKIAAESSTHLLHAMSAAGSGGCMGLNGEPIEFLNEKRKMRIPGLPEISMINSTDIGRIRRVNNVKAPLYKWINDCSEEAPSHAGHSAHDILKIKPSDVQLITSDIRAANSSGVATKVGAGSRDGTPSPRALSTSPLKKKAVLIWAGLYRDFILRAAKKLLDDDHGGLKVLGGEASYLKAIKVSVCLPAEGETKFPWQLTSFIFDAIKLATKGFTGRFKPLADISPTYEADVCRDPGSSSSDEKPLAKKGSSRILICSESRAVMQYLFTQKIRDAVKNQKDWESFPDQICAMIIDPGHGTTDVSIVILDKATLTVVKHARADFGESVGGKDVDDHFEKLVVAPFLEGMREALQMNSESFNLNDFKIENDGLEKKWRVIKERWCGKESSELQNSGLATLPFHLFKRYLQNKGISQDKFKIARKAGLQKVLAGDDVKKLMKSVGGIQPPDCVSFLLDGEDMKLEWQLLKACFDKMLVPLDEKMKEACQHPLLDKKHKVHLLCLAGGASNSFHVRKELERIVRDANVAAPNMSSGIYLSQLGGLRSNVPELPCLGALVDAWLRPDDIEAVRSSVAHYSYSKPGLHGVDLADELKNELRTRDDQIGVDDDNIFFKDLDEYVATNPDVHEILIAVPMTSKGQLYCPTIGIPRYVLGSPDYTVSGKGEIFVGHIKKPAQPDQWIDGKRKIHQRFLVLPKGDLRRHKKHGYYSRALHYNPSDPVYIPTSAEASVLRLTMDETGHFNASLLDLNTGATTGQEERTRSVPRVSEHGRSSASSVIPSPSSRGPKSSTRTSDGTGRDAKTLSGHKRSRIDSDTEDEVVERNDEDDKNDGSGAPVPKAQKSSSGHQQPSRRSHRAPSTKCTNAGRRGFCSMLAPSDLWWFKTSTGWMSGSGEGEKYCASCHTKLVAQEGRAQPSPLNHKIDEESDDDDDEDDDAAEALICMRYN